jgi:hypothetical protein
MRKAAKTSTTQAVTRTSRRVLVTGADPVHALITTAKQKNKAFSDCPDDQADQCEKAHAAEWVTIDEIVASKPTSLAGVAAVLRFFAERMDRDAYCQQELIETLLGSMATALDRIAAGRVS